MLSTLAEQIDEDHIEGVLGQPDQGWLRMLKQLATPLLASTSARSSVTIRRQRPEENSFQGCLYPYLSDGVMEVFEEGLRCQDIHAGLRSIDPNSAGLAEMDDTRLIGMAASLASAIRGQDVIGDAQMLKVVAADQLDVDSLVFPQVIELLDVVGFVHTVEHASGKIVRFAESIPFHENLYEALGELWRQRHPTQIEEVMVATVHRLAAGPVPADEIANAVGIDGADLGRVLEIGRDADLIKGVATVDGEILYSPFMGFEHPDLLGQVFEEHGPDQFQEEFGQLRQYQGLPVDPDGFPALSDAIARGLLLGPSVERPDGAVQPFACAPYSLDLDLYTVRKPILDKALAVLACVRCGQHFGGTTGITRPVAILDTLLDPARGALHAHSSSRRQYQPLFRMQIVDFEPSGNWVIPKLIRTDDNVAAVRLARDLIKHGEVISDRVAGEADARRLLMPDGQYLTPIRTVQKRRAGKHLTDKQWEKAMDALMGRTAQ